MPKRLGEKANELINFREEIVQLRRGPSRSWRHLVNSPRHSLIKGDFAGRAPRSPSGGTAAQSMREQA